MNKEKLTKSVTSDGQPPAPGFEDASAPQPIGASGQHGAYWVLSEEERARGFIRPIRRSYRHVGPEGPKHPLRDLTAEEQGWFGSSRYVKFEPGPESDSSLIGRFWTQEQLDQVRRGCGSVTTMGRALYETWARDPSYYGQTFCSGCGSHLPVDQFRWVEDGEVVGS